MPRKLDSCTVLQAAFLLVTLALAASKENCKATQNTRSPGNNTKGKPNKGKANLVKVKMNEQNRQSLEGFAFPLVVVAWPRVVSQLISSRHSSAVCLVSLGRLERKTDLKRLVDLTRHGE